MKEGILIQNASIEQIETIVINSVRIVIEKELLNRIDKKDEKKGISYLSRKQTAKALGISLPTLHKWTVKGILKGYRIGNSVRYKLSEVEDSLVLIQSNKYKRNK